MADVVNPLFMSDEDFLKNEGEMLAALPSEDGSELTTETTEAPVADATGAEVVEGVEGDANDEAGQGADGVSEEEKAKADEAAEGTEGEGKADDDKPAGEEGTEGGDAPSGAEKTDEQKAAEEAAKKTEGAVPPSGSEAAKPKEGQEPAPSENAPVNYADIGEQIMKPFKAAGKDLQVKNADEAIKLMQMGAHFTQKMQAIQPHRKALTMLENNGLLDPGKLDFLIAIEKRDPEAIKKLIKDAGIDPMDIDTSVDPQYRGGSHIVTDAEVEFTSRVEELSSTPTGRESLELFDKTWDHASKDAVWAKPELMTHLHAQRESGMYDRIAAEVERRKTFGQIAPSTAFIAAYEAVGVEMAQAGMFNDILPQPKTTTPPVPSLVPPAPQVQTKPEPVAKRAAAPKQGIDNNDKAAAASPTKASPKPAKAFINPLAMADDQFLAEFQDRL